MSADGIKQRIAEIQKTIQPLQRELNELFLALTLQCWRNGFK